MNCIDVCDKVNNCLKYKMVKYDPHCVGQVQVCNQYIEEHKVDKIIEFVDYWLMSNTTIPVEKIISLKDEIRKNFG